MSDDHSLAWGAYGFSIALLVVAAVLLATVFVAPFGDGKLRASVRCVQPGTRFVCCDGMGREAQP